MLNWGPTLYWSLEKELEARMLFPFFCFCKVGSVLVFPLRDVWELAKHMNLESELMLKN